MLEEFEFRAYRATSHHGYYVVLVHKKCGQNIVTGKIKADKAFKAIKNHKCKEKNVS